jgi:hypothetical protein
MVYLLWQEGAGGYLSLTNHIWGLVACRKLYPTSYSSHSELRGNIGWKVRRERKKQLANYPAEAAPVGERRSVSSLAAKYTRARDSEVKHTMQD